MSLANLAKDFSMIDYALDANQNPQGLLPKEFLPVATNN
jgi:hypothetical protein